MARCSEFCRIHYIVGPDEADQGIILVDDSLVRDSGLIDNIGHDFAMFVNVIGVPMHEHHVNKFRSTCLEQIYRANVELALVSETVLKETAVHDIWSQILVSPTSKQLVLQQPYNVSLYDMNDMLESTLEFNHNVYTDAFEEFVNATDTYSYEMPGVSNAIHPETKMVPRVEASTILVSHSLVTLSNRPPTPVR